MTRQLLIFFIIIHLCIGGALAFFNGEFYGDAKNFYGYSNEIGSAKDFLNWEDWTSIYNINVYFVSTLYGSALQAAIVNTVALLYFISVLRNKKLIIKRNYLLRNNKHYLVVLFVILCPSIIARFAEPSREYLLSLSLFLVGFFYTLKNRRSLFWTMLCLAIMVRPIAAPIYILWFCFFWAMNKSVSIKIVLSCVFIVLASASQELEVIKLYSQKSEDYQGILSDAQPLVYKIFLNVFGDVNSFITDRYSGLERLVFFLDYIWRILILIYLVRHGGSKAFSFIVFAALITAIVYPFPHPRYFVPALFFLAGIVARHLIYDFSQVKKFKESCCD